MIYTENDIKQFDKWRGLLSVIVLLCHIFQIFWMPLLGNEGLCISFFSTIANISVVFFFLLSGIQISAGSLNINRNKTFFWKVFLRNRFIRIYPTLIAMLLICYILVLIFPVLNSGSFEIKRLASDKLLAREFFYSKPKSFFKALFMIYPAIFEINGPLWSLFIEWWIYISVMFFAISYSIRSTPLFCFFYCLIGFLILYGIFYFYGVRALTYIIIWYLGFIYTIYLRNNYQLLNWMTFLFLFISFTLILNSGFIILDFSSSSYKKYAIFQFMFSLFFLRFFNKFHFNNFFRLVSKYSYTLYVFHFPISLFLFAIFHFWIKDDLVKLIIATVFVLIINFKIAKIIGSVTENRYRLISFLEKFYFFKSISKDT